MEILLLRGDISVFSWGEIFKTKVYATGKVAIFVDSNAIGFGRPNPPNLLNKIRGQVRGT